MRRDQEQSVLLARTVLTHFYSHQFDQATPSIEPLGSAGGFSGAELWKISDVNNLFCLRRWPNRTNGNEAQKQKLTWIHNQLATAAANGCDFVPVPVVPDASAGSERGFEALTTLVSFQGCFWQLEPWMSGEANYWNEPTQEKLNNAMSTLAKFHLALNDIPSVPVSKTHSQTTLQLSSGLQVRLKRLSELYDGKKPTELFLKIESATQNEQVASWLQKFGFKLCQGFRVRVDTVFRQLNQFANQPVETGIVIGDVWHDHVLFTDSQVTGLVDFGTLKADTRVSDVARLLHSLVGDDSEAIEFGWDVYNRAFPIESSGRQLMRLFDSSGTLISGMNWLQWLCLEDRSFENLSAIQDRLQRIARRLRTLSVSPKLEES